MIPERWVITNKPQKKKKKGEFALIAHEKKIRVRIRKYEDHFKKLPRYFIS